MKIKLDPPRPTHPEILEEEQVMAYHVVDVLPRCICIVEIKQLSIDREPFPNGSELRDVLYAIMGKAR